MAEKKQSPQGPERFLFKSAGIALWGFSLMLFIMLLPAIALKMNPASEQAGPEALKTQSLIAFSPLFMTIALVITALFFAVLQNKYFVATAIAEGKTAGKENLKRMLIPVLRYKEILLLAGDKPLIKPMIICSALFWISMLVFGLLSPFPFFFFLAAVLLFYASVKKSTGKCFGKILRGWTFILLIVFLLSSVDGLRAVNAPAAAADPAIPRDRRELAELLEKDVKPCPEFIQMAQQYISGNHVCDKLNDALFYYAVPLKFRKEAEKVLADPQTEKTFAPLEKALDEGKRFNYGFSSAEYLWYRPGSNYFNRVAGRYFGAKILQALEKGNREEVMKNFRRLSRFQENIQNGSFCFNLISASNLELNRAFLVGAMLSRNILTDADLQEIASLNAGREQKLHAILVTALRSEALLERELICDMMKLYPWIQSSESVDGKLFQSSILRFLLRGNNAFPPNTWNKVIQNKILDESTAKFNAMLKKYPGQKNLPQDKEKFKGTYFVTLNFESQKSTVCSLYHAVTCVRLTDLALNVEKFRRTHKRLPETLAELKIVIPVDAVTGEKLGYKSSGFEIETYPGPGKRKRMKFDGWQLHGTVKDYINISVPAAWPVPAPLAE